MGETFLTSMAWLGLANAAVSAVLVGIALACTRWSRSTTLVSVLWTLAILKLISPALATVPIPVPAFSWASASTDQTASEAKSSTKSRAAAGQKASKSPRTSQADIGNRSDAAPTAPHRSSLNTSTLLSAFFAVWILGIVVLATLALARIVALKRLVRRAEPAPGWVHQDVAECCQSLGIRRIPQIRMLEIAISPLVGAIGWRPLLLLPRNFYGELSKNERQLLLAHEIAHLRRWDHLRAWLELVAVTIFWWDPLAWYARRRSRQAAEDCCDSWVVHWFPERAADYAEVLLKCVDLCSPPSRRLPGPMYAMSRFALTRQRLLAILASPRPPQMSRLGTISVLAIALVFLSSIPVAGQPRTDAAAQARPFADALSEIDLRSGESRPANKPFFVDLEPHANVRLDEDFGRTLNNNLNPVPRGRQRFGETEYQVGDSFILLASHMAPGRPQAATGIRIGGRIDSLNVFHGAGWSPFEDGVEIGSLIVNYAGGSSEKVPIVYGLDVRDWWDVDRNAAVERGKVIWRGANAASYRIKGNVVALRLYELTWTNPHPDRVIETIDFVSTNTSDCAPFLIAMTANQRGASD
jgi:beta-lactamase regulating signal transducer with metallopeptidase domain